MRKSSTNAYLLALSSSNLVSLLCLILMVSLRFTLVHPYRTIYCTHWYESFISLAIPYLTPINQLSQLVGIYLIISVSIDRLILVVHSKDMKISARMRKKRRLVTWIVIFLIFLCCFMFTLPNWFLYKSVQVKLNITKGDLAFDSPLLIPFKNESQKHLAYTLEFYINEYTPFGKNNLVKTLLNIYLYIPFVFGIPITVLLLVNSLIIYELIKISARKRQLGTAATIDRNITIMLLMIVILFLVCQVPLAFSHIYLVYEPEMMYDKNFFYYHSFTNFLTIIYLSANFVLFCFFGQEFRDTIQYMFCLKNDLPFYTKNYYKRRFTFQSLYQTIKNRRDSSLAHKNSKHRDVSLRVKAENEAEANDVYEEKRLSFKTIKFKDLNLNNNV